MKITLINMYGTRHVDCEIDPNKPFIEIFAEFRQELNSSKIQKDEVRMQMLEYATLPNIKPSIHTDVIYPRTEFDFWKTPIELGVSDGAEIWLNRDTVFAAGILPLNALYYHFDELKKFCEKIYADYNAYSSVNLGKDLKQGIEKEAVVKEIERVHKVFDQRALMAGSGLLLKIMRQFESSFDTKTFYLIKNGQVGWVSAYVDDVMED